MLRPLSQAPLRAVYSTRAHGHTTRFAEFNTGEYVIRNVKNVLRIQIGVCGVRRLEVFLVENLLAET